MRRFRDDRGALVVEAAFVFPIFLTILFGIVDLGYAEFQTSQATAAARDGARVAILDYATADQSGSTDFQAVVTQVNQRLAGQQATVTVQCLSGLTGSTPVSCASAVPDSDRIKVSVSWSYGALTPVMASFGPKTIAGTATMAILGAPVSLPTTTTTTVPNTTSTSTTTTVPGTCGVTDLTANPALPINVENNGTDLQRDTTFTATTTGAATCTGLTIQLPTKTTSTTLSLSNSGGPSWSVTIGSSQLQWQAGTGLPLLIQSSSGTTLPGGSFTVDVQ